MGITIYDVATAAGVSPATVSRVLGGGASVAPETASRVREVVERLGYRPDRVAQALRRQRSAMVGLLLPIARYPAALQLLRGLERALAAQDISLLLADGSAGNESHSEVLARLLAQRVDALLVVKSDRTAIMPPNGGDVPAILVDSGPAEETADAVRADHAAGIRQAVRLLVREGAERIAFLGEGTATIVGAEQLEGFTAAAREAGSVDTMLRMGPASQEFGRAMATELLATTRPPDAYVCGSDLVATTVCSVLRGRFEPAERPLVVGYGGADWTGFLSPALTTLRIPAGEIAEEAVRLVSRRLGGFGGDPIDIVLPPSLVVRESA